jgi:hypothetical protein
MKLLKVTQVMEKLNISRGKAYSMVKKGIIPSVNIDGCIRVPEQLLNKMLYRKLGIEGKPDTKTENIHILSGGEAERSK